MHETEGKKKKKKEVVVVFRHFTDSHQLIRNVGYKVTSKLTYTTRESEGQYVLTPSDNLWTVRGSGRRQVDPRLSFVRAREPELSQSKTFGRGRATPPPTAPSVSTTLRCDLRTPGRRPPFLESGNTPNTVLRFTKGGLGVWDSGRYWVHINFDLTDASGL